MYVVVKLVLWIKRIGKFEESKSWNCGNGRIRVAGTMVLVGIKEMESLWIVGDLRGRERL